MGLEFDHLDGQTPLDEEERDGLVNRFIMSRSDVDEHEQRNIQKAIQWTLGRRFKKTEILTADFVRLVHKKMYGDVWRWAGTFRKTNKNIGVDHFQIPSELHRLLGDCEYWIDNGIYSPDEIAVRFKHRIVYIHCFPNGNGRHSRLMADIIVNHLFDRGVFTWGGNSDLARDGKARTQYIAAVKAADANDIIPLLNFSRS